MKDVHRRYTIVIIISIISLIAGTAPVCVSGLAGMGGMSAGGLGGGMTTIMAGATPGMSPPGFATVSALVPALWSMAGINTPSPMGKVLTGMFTEIVPMSTITMPIN